MRPKCKLPMKSLLIAVTTVGVGALMAAVFEANLRSDSHKRLLHRAALRSACTALEVAVRTHNPKNGGEALALANMESASKLLCPIHNLQFKVNTNAVLLLRSVGTNDEEVLVCPTSLPEGIFGYEFDGITITGRPIKLKTLPDWAK